MHHLKINMGYYIFSFGIKEKEVLKTFNSKNEEIIKKVEENEHFQCYNKDDYLNKKVSTKNALLDIINGNEMNDKFGYQYGYAVISLCATLGKKLPCQQEIKLGYADYINQYIQKDFELNDFDFEELLFSDEKLSSFPIPNVEDWPMISVIKLEELKELKDQLKHIEISGEKIEELIDSNDEDDEEKGYSYEHIKGFIDNVNFCIENELDLFSACH